MLRTLSRSILLPAAALLALWLARAGASPTVTFEIDPPNPVAGQAVSLRDTSASGGTSWLWDFGDGASATQPAPSHAWAGAGSYDVRLTTQGTTVAQSITVSDPATLRLLGAHPFEISIQVRDPNTGAASAAQAVAVTDRFGWFSFPTLTHDPGNPEVTVKVLEAPTFGHYWIFWSAMTSLHYTMTVRDVATGQVQVYEKNDDSPCGSWDLQSFPYVSPAPPTETPAPGQPTRTRTPPRTPTQTPTTTPTPTPSGPTALTLRAVSWDWAWCTSERPCTAGTCGYEVTSESFLVAGNTVTCNACGIKLHMGCTYDLTLFNGDSLYGDQQNPHEMNAHPEIGMPDVSLFPQGESHTVLTIPTGTAFDVPFACKNGSCANGGPPETTHETMLGIVHVVP